MMKKINIGCGNRKKEGYLNIDLYEGCNPDMVVDISKGLPFEDNSFDEVYSSHVLEHIEPDKFRFVLSEIIRVIKPNGILELYLPFDNIQCRVNLDHFRTFGFTSFDQLCDNETYFLNARYKFRLERVIAKPNKLYRTFYNLFPFLLHEVYFKFRVLKK